MTESTKTLVEQLAALPNETDPTYGAAARDIIRDIDGVRPQLTSILETTDSVYNDQIQFNAFYCLQVCERRSKRFYKHRKNVDRYQTRFESHPMFLFMQAEYYSAMSSDPESRVLAIKYARKSAEALPEVPGILHLLAELLLESVEFSFTSSEDKDAQTSALMEADRLLRSAIELSNRSYAKYYATRARVAIQLGIFDTALGLINKAIDKEPLTSSASEYRISEYEIIRREIFTAVAYKEMQREQESAVREFRGMRGEVLGLLGLLAAVIAFLGSSVTMARDFTLPSAIILQLVSAAAILIIFWGYQVLLVRRDSGKKFWIVPSAALFIILTSAGLVWWLSV